MKEERKTYRDNNGFLRYEDNCKLVVIKEPTKEDIERAEYIYKLFRGDFIVKEEA